MPSSIQLKVWQNVAELLSEARSILVTALSSGQVAEPPLSIEHALKFFDEFLENNEFELAWETLSRAAQKYKVPPLFWERLVQAAEVMGLESHQRFAEREANRGRQRLVISAYLSVGGTASTDLVVADPELDARFLEECRRLGLTIPDADLNWLLFNARKEKKVSKKKQIVKFTIPRERRDQFEFASEIAVRYVQRNVRDVSLDRIICDPDLVRFFDAAASRLAPGFRQVEYRWAALGLRKARRLTKTSTVSQLPQFHFLGSTNLMQLGSLPTSPGVYLFRAEQPLFIGETTNLQNRIAKHLSAGDGGIPSWLLPHTGAIELGLIDLKSETAARRKAIELAAIRSLRPVLNYLEPSESEAG